MICLGCNSDGRAEPCAFCQNKTELDTKVDEVRDRLFRSSSHDNLIPIWECNGRYWYSYAPGEVLEITSDEMTEFKNGRRLDEILEVRLAKFSADNV